MCEKFCVREKEKSASIVGQFVGATREVIVTGYVAMVSLMDSE